jgi:hypothetical protein
LLRNKDRRGPLVVLTALFVYGLGFIARTSFPVEGTRYFSLLDDAMISMRYAKNFANGHGLVWNPGEYIEGFTNLLWTLYMSAWHLLPIPPHLMSLPIQLTSLAALIISGTQIYKIIEPVIEDKALRIATLAMAVFYWPLILWSLLGMEVGIITMMLMIAVRMVLTKQLNTRSLLVLYGLLGVMTLVRFDTVIYLIAISGYLMWRDRASRTRHTVFLLTTLAIFIGGQTAWRLSYYGEFFPNTYYLKMTGFPMLHRISRGLYEIFNLAHQPGLVLFILPIVWNLWRRTAHTNFFLILIGVAFAYSAYVGGDAWEWYGGANRYLIPVMPLYFILLFKCLEDLWQLLRAHIALSSSRTKWLGAIGFVLLYLTYNIPNVTAWNPDSIDELLLIERPFEVPEHITRVEQAKWLNAHTKPDAKIAVTWAGITPYFADHFFIDLYGKCDKHVARTPGRYWSGSRKGLGYVPGHAKWDYAYSIGKLEPDVILQLIEHEERPSKMLSYYAATHINSAIIYRRQDTVSTDYKSLH